MLWDSFDSIINLTIKCKTNARKELVSKFQHWIENWEGLETRYFFFISSRTWLEKNPILLATAVYTYLRLLEDHEAAPFKNLRQMEIEFCSSLLREKVPWYILQ